MSSAPADSAPAAQPAPTPRPALAELWPASYRTPADDIAVPATNPVQFFNDELRVTRLNALHDWLWLAGRAMPPRPLHHQVVLSRDIIVTEQPALHLLWSKQRIYIKPLPAFLVDDKLDFHDALEQHCTPGERAALIACARGFFFSYTALLGRRSDFDLALQLRLVPESLTWPRWKALVEGFLQRYDYPDYNPRYYYGELRLGRLNTVTRFVTGSAFATYTNVDGYTFYGDFLQDNLAAIAGVLGYVVIVLTAMQVGLATEQLQPNKTFQNASFGFTVFSILAPLVLLGLSLGMFVVLIVYNWIVTRKYLHMRFHHMGVATTRSS